MKTILRVAATATVALLASTAQAETRLTMSSWLPSGHPLVQDVMKPWAASVAEATDGRVKVIILPSSLGHPKVHYDIAREGQADITYGGHGYTPGRFKLYKMVEFPFGGNSAEATSVAYWNVYNEYLKPAGEHKDVKLLGLFTHGPGHIHNSKRTVQSAEDMKGLKLRVGGGVASDLASALGSVSIQKPSSSSYELVSSGVADGTLFPHESVVAFNIEDKLTHTTLVPGGTHNFSFYLVMNRDRFADLPEEDRKAIESVSGEAFARLAGRMWDTQDAKGLEAIRANGNEVVTAPDAFLTEIRQASAPMEEAWLKVADEQGVDGRAALEAFRAQSHQLDQSLTQTR
ncbi:TRAP transporter substrate-binding protein [Marinobacterium marinum]|uniref:TRAP transporter substrate-binding protein n=1 Tax=Marinobacterium marinum TaxID=2756129 RepID=A0A7W2ABK1_9GAMM|nr:TRAP transporter substrate-binding protein [Marinobacterium marinum]MBA4501567.1 TRAP transporter substrate-binding protein [Marinobacterium marinum]